MEENFDISKPIKAYDFFQLSLKIQGLHDEIDALHQEKERVKYKTEASYEPNATDVWYHYYTKAKLRYWIGFVLSVIIAITLYISGFLMAYRLYPNTVGLFWAMLAAVALFGIGIAIKAWDRSEGAQVFFYGVPFIIFLYVIFEIWGTPWTNWLCMIFPAVALLIALVPGLTIFKEDNIMNRLEKSSAYQRELEVAKVKDIEETQKAQQKAREELKELEEKYKDKYKQYEIYKPVYDMWLKRSKGLPFTQGGDAEVNGMICCLLGLSTIDTPHALITQAYEICCKRKYEQKAKQERCMELADEVAKEFSDIFNSL